MNLLSVRNLTTVFDTRNGLVRAVSGLNLEIAKGETLAIVGESGSGKSVAMQSLLGLIPKPPGKILSGEALFNGIDLLQLRESQMRSVRGSRIGLIFQDPMSSLNPYMSVAAQMTEVLRFHKRASRAEARRQSVAMLERVGIPEATRRFDQFPHQFSGGMRQRVAIAMALLAGPELLIADEPTTALDVTIQAQIIELLKELQRERGMAMIIITHDLGVVAGVSDRILVMYAGRLAETGGVDAIYYQSKHPYTRALLGSIPSVAAEGGRLSAVPGLPPDLSRLGAGCAFAPRCTMAAEICRGGREIVPVALKEQGHLSTCLRTEELQ